LFLIKSGGFFLHASAAFYEKKGCLFIGPAGSGKTTVINKLSKDFDILSDELVAIRKNNGYYYIYSTPWIENKRKISKLKSIFFLKKSKGVQFKKVKTLQAAFGIYSNILYHVLDYSLANKLLNKVTNLSHEISCYAMYFALDSPISEKIKNKLNEN
jgi:ABC-type phosphate transport system ATPase subunit